MSARRSVSEMTAAAQRGSGMDVLTPPVPGTTPLSPVKDTSPPSPPGAKGVDPGTSASRDTRVPMVKRSFYLTRAFAAELAAAVDDLHFATRCDKYECLEAIIRPGLADLAAIETELRGRGSEHAQGPPGR